jgi:hypothetical protein
MAIKDASLFEQANGPVNRCYANLWVDRGCTAIQFFDVWVIVGIRYDARDDPALVGDAKAAFLAKCL